MMIITDKDVDFEMIRNTIPHIILHLQASDTKDEEFNKIYCKVLFKANQLLGELKDKSSTD